MRYLVLAREDPTNEVEGRALTTKTTTAVCKFLIEDVICQYGCVGKIMADCGELDVEEAEELFDRLGGQVVPHNNVQPGGKREG